MHKAPVGYANRSLLWVGTSMLRVPFLHSGIFFFSPRILRKDEGFARVPVCQNYLIYTTMTEDLWGGYIREVFPFLEDFTMW